jgi:hypothetical protein
VFPTLISLFGVVDLKIKSSGTEAMVRPYNFSSNPPTSRLESGHQLIYHRHEEAFYNLVEELNPKISTPNLNFIS